MANGDQLPFQNFEVIPFTAITSEWGNGTGDNILALAAGTGLDDGAVTPAKRSGGYAMGTFNITSSSNIVVSTLDFRPKKLTFMTVPQEAFLTAFSSLSLGYAVVDGAGVITNRLVWSGVRHSNIAETATLNACIMRRSLPSSGSSATSTTAHVSAVSDNGFTVTMNVFGNDAFVTWVAEA